MFVAVCIGAPSCKHDAPSSTTSNAAHDAGAGAAHADAAHADAAHADAAHADASAASAAVDADTSPPSGTPIATGSAPLEAATASVFDRILAKPNDANATPESLIPIVEQATGAKVARARRTAVHWMLFQLAPANRTADDQAKAIDAIKATGAFSAVEGDRVMKAQ
jgi:hypothetical protein